jgi:hypothetical protein
LSGGALVAQPWLRFHPPLLSGGALVAQPWLRFHTPLIEPDMQISRWLFVDIFW